PVPAKIPQFRQTDQQTPGVLFTPADFQTGRRAEKNCHGFTRRDQSTTHIYKKRTGQGTETGDIKMGSRITGRFASDIQVPASGYIEKFWIISGGGSIGGTSQNYDQSEGS